MSELKPLKYLHRKWRGIMDIEAIRKSPPEQFEYGKPIYYDMSIFKSHVREGHLDIVYWGQRIMDVSPDGRVYLWNCPQHTCGHTNRWKSLLAQGHIYTKISRRADGSTYRNLYHYNQQHCNTRLIGSIYKRSEIGLDENDSLALAPAELEPIPQYKKDNKLYRDFNRYLGDLLSVMSARVTMSNTADIVRAAFKTYYPRTQLTRYYAAQNPEQIPSNGWSAQKTAQSKLYEEIEHCYINRHPLSPHAEIYLLVGYGPQHIGIHDSVTQYMTGVSVLARKDLQQRFLRAHCLLPSNADSSNEQHNRQGELLQDGGFREVPLHGETKVFGQSSRAA